MRGKIQEWFSSEGFWNDQLGVVVTAVRAYIVMRREIGTQVERNQRDELRRAA
jgi:hypothetical protein